MAPFFAVLLLVVGAPLPAGAQPAQKPLAHASTCPIAPSSDPRSLEPYRAASALESPDELSACALSPDKGIRSAVGRNWRTPAHTLHLLAHDAHEHVRSAVASNAHAPEDVLRVLASDPHWAVSSQVALNPSMPGDVLEGFISAALRSLDEFSTAVVPYQLQLNDFIAQKLALNPAAPEAVLRELATHPWLSVRQNVAMNPALPADVLDKLVWDPVELVRVQAVANQRRRAEALKPEPCDFGGGFKLVHDLIPSVVGECTQNERPQPNGDTLQRTKHGILIWRRATNATYFFGGSQTWVLGPNGLEQRSSNTRLPWELTETAQAAPALIPVPAVAPSALAPVSLPDLATLGSPDVAPLLERLALYEQASGTPLLRGLREAGVRVEYGELPEYLGAGYWPGQNRITLSSRFREAPVEAQAALLAHEAQHVLDHAGRGFARSEVECLSRETTAFRTQASYWAWMHGLAGKSDVGHDLERELNLVLHLAQEQPDLLLFVLMVSYWHQCAHTT